MLLSLEFEKHYYIFLVFTLMLGYFNTYFGKSFCLFYLKCGHERYDRFFHLERDQIEIESCSE